MEQQRLQLLIEKCLSGKATAEEQQELDDWYAAQDTGPALDEPTKREMGKEVYLNIHHRIQRRSGVGNWLMAAVVLVLVAVGGFYFFADKPAPPMAVWKEERTGTEVKNLRLPDGSTVWLNAGTVIRYDSLFNQRNIWLHGEAFFDVAHVQGKPFKVHTGRVTTRVLGTAFNIDAYDTTQNISVFVKRGRVMVYDGKDSSGVLLPNQQVLYAADGHFARTDSIDPGSWTSGQLVFRDMPFSEVAKRLERRFGIQMQFKNEGIGHCRITASFEANTPLKDILEMVALTNGSVITADGHNRWTISGKLSCQ